MNEQVKGAGTVKMSRIDNSTDLTNALKRIEVLENALNEKTGYVALLVTELNKGKDVVTQAAIVLEDIAQQRISIMVTENRLAEIMAANAQRLLKTAAELRMSHPADGYMHV